MSKPEYWKAVKAAHSEVGYLEKKSNAQLEEKTANAGYNNWTKYPKKIYEAAGKQGKKGLVKEIDYGAAWCDCFCDYCMLAASDMDVADAAGALCGRFDDYTPNSVSMYKRAGRWGSKPKLGAQVFFGSGGEPTHTGIVYAYGPTAVKTVEGNTSSASGVVANGGGVFRKEYELGYGRIIGYGYPRYASEPPSPGKFRMTVDIAVRKAPRATAGKVKTATSGTAARFSALRVNKHGNTWGYSDALGGWVCLEKKGKPNAVAV